MKDIVIVALLVVAFALVITTHVAIAIGLAKRTPRWRGAVALVLPPLAPYWAWQERMRTRVGLWAGGLLLYVIMLVLASRV
ncbi:MAG: hypothetical protein KF894_13705 [Labilithrix sp.]|nr:hypothetical protein [Labilithrix sp.]